MYQQGQIKWEKISEFWHKKIFINNSGKAIITYHYKSRSSDPCLVLEIGTRIAKRYCGYKLIEKDIRNVRAFCDQLKDVCVAKINKKDEVLVKALYISIISSYGKCFSEAHGRKIKLDKSFIAKKYEDLHKELINARNQYIAHAGGAGYEESKFIMLLSPLKKKKQNINVLPLLEVSQKYDAKEFYNNNNLQGLIGLLEELKVKINKKAEKILVRLNKEVDKIDLNKACQQLTKSSYGNRIKIDDDNLLS